jgi:SAM-dependent methyltransferase
MQAGAPGLRPDFRAIAVEDGGVARRLRVPGDWRRPGADGAYELFWRAEDGFGQLLPRPDAAAVREFYRLPQYYTHHHRAPSDGRGDGLSWRILRHLAWRFDRGVEPTDAWLSGLAGAAPRDCLEIGCGKGEILVRLRAMGHEVTGFDPDADALALAAAAGVSVHEGSAEAPPAALAGRHFDLVLMLHVLEHCLDPAAALAGAFAVTRPGGTFVVEVPNNTCAGLDVFGTAWLWLDVPRHLNFFSRRSLEAAVAAAGFAVDRVEFSGYARQFSPEWRQMHGEIGRGFGRSGLDGLSPALGLFLRTALASPERRYDTLRVIAHRPGGGAG